MDFDRSVSKLKKEQEKRRAEALRKAERERKAQEEAKRQHQLIQDAVEKRRQAQLDRIEQDRLAAEEEKRLTAGITYSCDLWPYTVSGEGDKIILPPSALETLTQQDALALGPMLFQLSLLPAEGNKSKQLPAGARVTHAGVLEFSAEDGRIGLPLKVRKSLVAEPEETREDGSRGMKERVEGPGGEEGDSRASPAWGSGWKVRVKYVRLEKGTYAKVQPRTGNLWHVPELKGMLEMNLQNHATLSEGDVLQVWYRGRCFDLRVTGLEPTQAVTVIDTDLTVDVEVPEEQTEREREESRLSADAGGVKGQVVGGGGPPPHVSQSCESRGQEAGMEEPSVNSGAKEEERRKRMMATQLSKLAPEPDEGNGDWIALVVRKPDGSMISRRFLRSQPFQDVFRFVEATSVSSDHDPLDMTYRLVTRFPRRVFTVGETAAQSVGEVLGSEAGKRETLMYEACA